MRNSHFHQTGQRGESDGIAHADTARLVETKSLPEYPVSRDTHLQAHYFTMFEHHRWLSSTLHLTAPMDVQGAALNLFFIAQSQTPIGSLPDDDLILSRLLRIDLTTWQGLRNRTVGALHNWVHCISDGELRLMHPVVTRVVLNAIERREEREASNEEKAVYERKKRLRAAMADLGCTKDVLADTVLIDRIDDWLLSTCKGQRRKSVYEGAMQHAARLGWFGGVSRSL